MSTTSHVPSTSPATGAGSSHGEIDSEMRKRVTEQLIARKFKGEIVGPDHAEYTERRTIWNAMVDKKPGLMVRCTCTEDVRAAVDVARINKLHPSMLCGGHNVAGKSLSEGGLTLDLRGMRNVTVDKANMLVHVDGGCQLGDVDAETAKFGLIVPAGIMSETGVAGLSLGGGIGWFSRKHGLTCDQFVSLEVVLASGEVVNVTEKDHPDLFWALKGGGGNFGVVTKFTFKAQKFGPMIRIGASLYEPENAVEALREYAKIYPTLPNHVGWHAALKHDMPKLPFVPPELVGRRLMMFITMWLEDSEDPKGIEMIEKLNNVGKPITKAMTVMPFAAGLQKVINEEFEDGHRYYTKEAHVATLANEAIDKLVDFWKDMPMEGEIEIIGLGGAITDLPEESAAFSNRQYQMWLNFAMRWDDAKNDPDYMERTRKVVRDLKPWVGKGVYVNMLNFDEQDRVAEAFGAEKLARLGKVKEKYDPENFFRVNYNIAPTAKS